VGQESAARYLPLIETEDLLAFGMIPEFIGRLPAVAALDPLRENELMRVMVEPRNAVIRQYQKFFEIEGVELVFEDDSLRAIAQDALRRETGVRAVRALVEDFLRDILYELPDAKDKVARYIVTEDSYRGKEPVQKVLRSEVKQRPPQRDSA